MSFPRSITPEILEQVVDQMLDVWEDEDHWCKGMIAQDANGHEVGDVSHSEAYRFCLVGVKNKAIYDLRLFDLSDEFDHYVGLSDEFDHYMDYVTRRQGTFGTAVRFNDDEHTTFEDVRLLVKRFKDQEYLTSWWEEECGDS